MSRALVDKLAAALLYEGYMLYPYRPSVKNRQRWTFGGLYPRPWSESQEGSDAWRMQTQCLLTHPGGAHLQVAVRFLHLLDRTLGLLPAPLAELPAHTEPEYRPVESLDVAGQNHLPWQEAVERDVDLGELDVDGLALHPRTVPFSFPASRTLEPLRSGGQIIGLLIRQQRPIAGVVHVSAVRVAEALFRVTIAIENHTALPAPAQITRDQALMLSFASTHTILGLRGGEFVSLLEPPDAWADHARECANIGTWPVLVGQPGQRDTMLSSPIILYDYPQIAPESPGDLFDSTEIDEILTLRIMTLTDAEKRAAAGIDPRAGALLARTEALAREQLAGLHGTFRGLQPLPGDTQNPPGRVTVAGVEFKPGDTVRLRPLGRADIFDIALAGKLATIVAIEEDFENRTHLAVTINDDPGRDFGLAGQPGHRFFFGVEEVELPDLSPGALP